MKYLTQLKSTNFISIHENCLEKKSKKKYSVRVGKIRVGVLYYNPQQCLKSNPHD
jgi:hypothetical protein